MEEKKYTLKELYKRGQISASVLNNAEIKTKVDQLKSKGISNGEAVNRVAASMGRSRQGVYSAIKKAL